MATPECLRRVLHGHSSLTTYSAPGDFRFGQPPTLGAMVPGTVVAGTEGTAYEPGSLVARFEDAVEGGLGGAAELGEAAGSNRIG